MAVVSWGFNVEVGIGGVILVLSFSGAVFEVLGTGVCLDT